MQNIDQNKKILTRQQYEIGKKEFQSAKKKKERNADVDNTVILKSIGPKNNCQCLIGYLDKVIKALALILPKESGYAKYFRN